MEQNKIKFLDINTGYSFDALWENDQSNGYVFWFPNEQSIDIIYTMPICMLSKENTKFTLSIDENEVFDFIDEDNINIIENSDGSIINELIGENGEYKRKFQKIVNGEDLGNGVYAYIFNVRCRSNYIGEYIDKIHISDYGFIKIGADFYAENESTTINLSNFGVEIPDGVQKTFFDTNVNEDYKDNIVLNRKFKELLSNYWDIIANKGSYKSLHNALKWFEWDDKLTIKEIEKYDVNGITQFRDVDIFTILENKVKEEFDNFFKTSYISLYYLTYKETDERVATGEEYNPKLEDVVLRWAKDDMRLKLSLLAQYFGAFFLPIHLSIMHATVEDLIFTNTIKSIYGTVQERNDSVANYDYISSNIKPNSVFKLNNVRAQVTDDTIFGIKYSENNDVSFGVDKFESLGMVTDKDESIKTFSQQYYGGPGVIIPIKLSLSNIFGNDFIKQTIVDLNINENTNRLYFYDKFYNKNGNIDIKFNLLAKESGNYEIKFTFILASSKTLIKKLTFSTEDIDNVNINLYKIKSKSDLNGFTYKDFDDNTVAGYLFKSTTESKNTYYTQSLTYMDPSNVLYSSYNGIKLNRTVIFDVSKSNNIELLSNIMKDKYLEFKKTDLNGNLSYLIYISKKFYEVLPAEINSNFYIYSNNLRFYPQFHKLELLNGNTINDYTISQYDSLCCAAELNYGKEIKPFKYSKDIVDAMWTFTNYTNKNSKKPIESPSCSTQPIIADKNNSLPEGYYNILFKYSLSNNYTGECVLNSAFRIKYI